MSVKKIVFTGGPAGGKSTIINMVKKNLEDRGYCVLVVSETATDLIPNGYSFDYFDSLFKFQNMILDYQYSKETKTDNLVKNSNKKDTVILYDRGILDNKAYFNNSSDFNYMMEKNNVSEIDILDSYDLVIDLVSTAVCAPEKYTTSNNSARKETVEDAKLLDSKTSNAWVGHDNLYLFNSNISINDEFECVMDIINQLLDDNIVDKKNSIEIDNTLDDFNKYDDNNSRLIDIEELVLSSKGKYIYKIRERKYKNNRSIILDLYEYENLIESRKISKEEYIELLLKYRVANIQNYKCLHFIYNLQPYEVKFYDNITKLEYVENKLNDKLMYPEEVKFFDKEKKYVKL